MNINKDQIYQDEHDKRVKAKDVLEAAKKLL